MSPLNEAHLGPSADDTASAAAPAPPLRKRDRTRAAVLAAAEALFTDKGIEGTTIDEIADAAEVSVGTIYRYFPGKVGIALDFVTTGLDALAVDMAKARQAPTSIERVEAAGDAYFRFAVEHPVASRFAAMRALQPNRSPEYATLNRECEERVHRLVMQVAHDVRDAMRAGEIPQAPMDDMMVQLWAQWNGIVALVLRGDGLAIPPEVGRRAVDRARQDLRYAAAMRQRKERAASGEPGDLPD